jgi:hypothetical protein
MSLLATARSTRVVARLSDPRKLNVLGLVTTAVGMLLQIVAGSTLYPSLAGPIVLIVTAGIVALGPARLGAYAGIAVPLVLGFGALVGATMNGGLIGQLTNAAAPGVLVGSVLHVVGLVAAIAGGVGMVMSRRAMGRER